MAIRDLFQLDTNVVFLNHGSFGACPIEIMEEYQRWQRQIESQPVEYIGRMHAPLLKIAREQLADYVNAKADNLVFVTNATTALNIVAWSVNLNPGDEVLTTNLEYGAMDRMWELICGIRGARYVKVPINLPIENEEEFTNHFTDYINDKTKVLFISMITSSTGLYLPINQLCNFAKAKGIISIIDGAHAPGQVPLDLENSSFDFFTGNCHKWMCAPKGTAFLMAKPSVQHLLKPLIISWGKIIDTNSNTDFINDFEYLGTRDISSFLSISKSIEFLNKYFTIEEHERVRNLLAYAKNGMCTILKTASIVTTLHNDMQMYAHSLPETINGKLLKERLYKDYKIEIPVSEQNGKQYIRISVQIYNTKEDVDFFLDKLEYLIYHADI